jgi:pheromone shutdown protein TraB
LEIKIGKLHRNPAGESCTEIMQELKTYLAIIPNEFLHQFDIALDRISHQSGVRPGSRIETIIPMATKTTYEVALTDEEAAVLALSCNGIYAHYTEKKITESMIEYVNENTR